MLHIRKSIAHETTDSHESWPGPDHAVTLECPLGDPESLREILLGEQRLHDDASVL